MSTILPRSVVVLATALVCGCASDARDTAEQKLEPTLTGPLLDTAAFAWSTLPDVASISDARRTPDGWVLVDGPGRRLHHLGDTSRRTRLWAGTGEGPGEVAIPQFAAVVDDTVWVVPPVPTRVDGFGPDGSFVRRVSLGAPPCAPALVHAVAPDPPRVAMAVQCLSPRGTMRFLGWASPADGVTEWIVWDGPGPLPANLEGRVDMDRMALSGGGGSLRSALSSDPCVRRYAPRHAATSAATADGRTWRDHATCIDPADRPPLGDEVVASLRRDLTPMAKRIGLRFEPPTHDGYFAQIFMTSRGLAASRPDGDLLVLESIESASDRWRIRLPVGVRPFIEGDHVLLVLPRMDGTAVARLPLARVVR